VPDGKNTAFAAALDQLAEIAYDFGPFFFAVLFTLVITSSARRWYLQAQRCRDLDTRNTYRNYFYASWLFGMLLVGVSVAWWLRSKWETHHTFAAAVVGLRPNQSLWPVSNDQYFWSRLSPHQGPLDRRNDYWFITVIDHPLFRGETFRLNYWELAGDGAINQAPPSPTATIEVKVEDPTQFPQRYVLEGSGPSIHAIPYSE